MRKSPEKQRGATKLVPTLSSEQIKLFVSHNQSLMTEYYSKNHSENPVNHQPSADQKCT